MIGFLLFQHFKLDDKDQKKSQKVLAELENIDDECDQVQMPSYQIMCIFFLVEYDIYREIYLLST